MHRPRRDERGAGHGGPLDAHRHGPAVPGGLAGEAGAGQRYRQRSAERGSTGRRRAGPGRLGRERIRRSGPAAGVRRGLHARRRPAALRTCPGESMEQELLTALGKALVEGSLTDTARLAALDRQPTVQILPEANVIKVGGQSFIDRGRAAVFPLIDEIVSNLPRHKMLIGTGAGTRARHAYSVGLDLGMPTGVLSVLGIFVSTQNARMLHFLLAKHGIPFIEQAQFAQLPLYLAERQAVIFVGMPPYNFYQPNPAVGRIPPHRTDTGAYLISEVFGARSMIYVKDEDGLYTADPKKDRGAKFIPRITVEELETLDLDDVVVERSVLALMKHAKHRRSIQVINGLVPGNLTRALNGEPVGTIITSGE